MELWDLPRSLVIVGGGDIAFELGQMFQRFGTAVTILERSERILSSYEPEVSAALTEIIQEEGVSITTGTTPRCPRGDCHRRVPVAAQQAASWQRSAPGV